MKHLNLSLYKLNSSYSPLLYKIVTLHTQIYNEQNHLHVDSRGASYLSPFSHSGIVPRHPLLWEEAQYSWVFVSFFYGFWWQSSTCTMTYVSPPPRWDEASVLTFTPFPVPRGGGARGESSGAPRLGDCVQHARSKHDDLSEVGVGVGVGVEVGVRSRGGAERHTAPQHEWNHFSRICPAAWGPSTSMLILWLTFKSPN